MKNRFNENVIESILTYSVSGIIIVSFALLIRNLPAISEAISKLFNLLLPFIIGFCIAFILSPLQIILENWLKKTFNLKYKSARMISVILTLLTLILFVALFFSILIPQLVKSSVLLITTVQNALDNFDMSNSFIGQYINNASIEDYINSLVQDGNTILGNMLASVSSYIPTVISYSYQIISKILNFIIGFIIAFYILCDKEKFKKQVRMVHYAFIPKKVADEIVEVLKLLSNLFTEFISGKAIDSLIIGIICAVCMTILGIPYVALISFVVGITNMIPVFGPFIGAIPSIFILVIINPVKALEFAIFILILQQVDGNIIGPHILGGSVGLPTFWVMFAIIIGGGCFGIVGMFIGVPIFATIYTLLRRLVNRRLNEKNITIE